MEPAVIAGCALAIIVALSVWRGLSQPFGASTYRSNASPMVWCSVRDSKVSGGGLVSLPCFLFWLALMIMIWLYLLGMPSIISGHFSSIEIAMTIIVGAASLIGIVAFVRLKSFLSGARVAGMFILFAVAQLLCFRLSLLPAVAHR